MGEDRKPDEDFVLLAEFNSGREEAFSRIVEKHSAALVNFLYRYTRDRQTSEDIAQEAFLRLYRAAPGLKPAARLSTVLYKIAYNLAVDFGRRARSRAERAPTHSLDAAAAAGREPAEGRGSDPRAAFETARRNEELAAALSELPDSQRLALILRVYEGRSYAEIAEITAATVSSVESLLFRARQALLKKLE